MNFTRLTKLAQSPERYMDGADQTIGQFSSAMVKRMLASVCIAGIYLTLYPVFQHMFSDDLSYGFIGAVTAILLALYIGQYFLIKQSSQQFYDVAYTLCDVLRLRMADHLNKLPLGMFQKEKVASVKSVITDDLQLIANYSGTLVGFFVTAVTVVLTLMTGLFFVNWQLATAMLAMVIIGLPTYYMMNAFVSKHSVKHFNNVSELSLSILEYVGGINILKSYGLETKSFDRLDTALDDTKKSILLLEVGSALFMVFSLLIVELSFPLMLGAGVYLLLDGSLDAATFIFVLILSVRMYMPVKEAMALSTEFKYLDKAIDRVADVFDLEPQFNVEQGPGIPSYDIEFDNVTFTYNETEGPVKQSEALFNDLNLTFKQGSVNALVGPSGSGKTTVTNLIARFWDVNAGAIKVGGINVREVPMDELLGGISFVFQDVVLFDDTIAENIRIANPNATDEEIIDAAKHAYCHDFIMGLPDGYNTRIGEGGGRLSGGEKQRLSIARAILKNAPILLLDEATASVDPSSERHIQKALQYVMKDKTVIMIAHKLSTVVNADQIIVMNEGKAEQIGTHKELLQQNGLYRILWDKQIRAGQWCVGQKDKEAASCFTDRILKGAV